MAIDATHPKYDANIADWQLIENVTLGKGIGQYLVKLNPLDTSERNRKRNEQYQERAVFYGLSGQTAKGMLGTMFSKWPKLEIPPDLEYMQESVDGAGVSIYQQSQAIADDLIRKARAGIAVSFPVVEGQVSRADIQSGRVVATIHRFAPEQIINWRTYQDGAMRKLDLVVLRELEQNIAGDDYKHTEQDTIREMILLGGVYHDRKWIQDPKTKEWVMTEDHIPLDASGTPWAEIPFTFLGAENNDFDVDHPAFLALAKMNIAHYRNSADFEDSVFYSGQAQAFVTGATQTWVEDLQKAGGFYIGGGSLMPIPEGGTFGFASAPPNPLVKEAMADKVEMMVGLGAKMLSSGEVAKTATQAAGELRAEHSQLSLIAGNISEAYTKALQWAGRFMGVEGAKMIYEVSQDFVDPEASPQELQQVIMGFMQGAIPASDYTAYMQRHGYFDQERTIEDTSELLAVPGVVVE